MSCSLKSRNVSGVGFPWLMLAPTVEKYLAGTDPVVGLATAHDMVVNFLSLAKRTFRNSSDGFYFELDNECGG